MTMSDYSIQTGASADPRRVVIYSQPGMGKTTLASYTPHPIFIQVEDGLAGIGADRLPLVKDYEDFTEQLRWLYKNKNGYKTLVIDSVDALNRHIENIVCKRNVVDSVAQIPYGGGYKLVSEEWGQLLAKTLQAFRHLTPHIALRSERLTGFIPAIPRSKRCQFEIDPGVILPNGFAVSLPVKCGKLPGT